MISGPLSRGLFLGEEMRLYVMSVDCDELITGNNEASLTEKKGEGLKEILSCYHMDKVYSSSHIRAKKRAEIAVPYLKAEIWHELSIDDKDSIRERVWAFMKEMESEDPDVFIAVFTHNLPLFEMLSYIGNKSVCDNSLSPSVSSLMLFDYRYGKWRIEDPFSY